MINSIYDAKILQVYNYKRLVSEIKKHNIYKPFDKLTTPSGNILRSALMVTPSEEYDGLPSFTQPVNISDTNTPVWVIDGRAFMRSGTPPVVVAKNDWSFQCIRIALMQSMDNDDIHPIRLGLLPGKVFSRWIVQSLTSRFNLDLSTQMSISVLSSFYYFQLLSKTPLNKENLVHYASHVSTMTGVPRERVLLLLDEIDEIHTIDQLIETFKRVTGNSRLNDMNFTSLFMILSTSWVGVHSRENVGVALQHLPTFLAMIYMAANDRSYRKTIITRHVENAGRVSDQQAFIKYIAALTRDYMSQ